jgi:hypothetical protein
VRPCRDSSLTQQANSRHSRTFLVVCGQKQEAANRGGLGRARTRPWKDHMPQAIFMPFIKLRQHHPAPRPCRGPGSKQPGLRTDASARCTPHAPLSIARNRPRLPRISQDKGAGCARLPAGLAARAPQWPQEIGRRLRVVTTHRFLPAGRYLPRPPSRLHRGFSRPRCQSDLMERSHGLRLCR